MYSINPRDLLVNENDLSEIKTFFYDIVVSVGVDFPSTENTTTTSDAVAGSNVDVPTAASSTSHTDDHNEQYKRMDFFDGIREI
jgi:hypothetical protein